jgi:uncharacterized protein YjiS (DUF1127 family)
MLVTVNAFTGGVASRSPGRSTLNIVLRASRSLAGWAERRRQLRALSKLNEHLLQDVGLSREDVRRACTQTFWMS